MNNPYKISLASFSTYSVINKFIGDNKLVLDVGCNEGYLGENSGLSNTFYGVDNYEPGIKKARKIYKKAEVLDLNLFERLPWNIIFDVLVFADVLEHLNNPYQVASKIIKKNSKTDSIVIISLPNFNNIFHRVSVLVWGYKLSDSGILDRTHRWIFNLEESKKLVKELGLKIEEVSGGSNYFGWLFAKANPLRRIFIDLFASSVVLKCKV